MDIKSFNNNSMGTNTYILSTDTKEAVIIDPVGSAESILYYIQANQLDVKFIILTHGHVDHIGLVSECKAATHAPLLIHSKDEEMLNDSNLNLSTMFQNPMEYHSDIQLKDGEELILGGHTLKIIHTPGHTPGSICIEVDEFLFTGDTVFKGSIGRSDFPGGDYNTIMDSVAKISSFNPELKIYPGHGDSSVLKYEIASNPFFQK